MPAEAALVDRVAAALKDARELYSDLLLDLVEFEASGEDDEDFLAEVRATGHDVGLFLLFLARVLEESEEQDAVEAAVMLRRARPLIDSLALLASARSRDDLLGLPLASVQSVEQAFADPAIAAWLARHAQA